MNCLKNFCRCLYTSFWGFLWKQNHRKESKVLLGVFLKVSLEFIRVFVRDSMEKIIQGSLSQNFPRNSFKEIFKDFFKEFSHNCVKKCYRNFLGTFSKVSTRDYSKKFFTNSFIHLDFFLTGTSSENHCLRNYKNNLPKKFAHNFVEIS